MRRKHFALAAAMAAALISSTVMAASSLDVTVSKAPIAPDGTTAGADSDFVLTFIDRNPAVPGIGLMAGGFVEVELPDAFEFVVAVVQPGAIENDILLDCLLLLLIFLLERLEIHPQSGFAVGPHVIQGTLTYRLRFKQRLNVFVLDLALV